VMFQKYFKQVIPWVLLYSAFPALLGMNQLFCSVFPAQPQENSSQENAINGVSTGSSGSIQITHLYTNRSPKEIFGSFYMILGSQLASRGQILAAEKLLSEAILWTPENANGHLNYGIVLESLDKFELATKEYQEAIRLDAKLFQARYNLGLLQDKMGETGKGLSSLHDALELDPKNAYINYDVGVLYAKEGDYFHSAKYSALATDYEKDFAEAYNNLGYALAHLGQYDKALLAIDKSLAIKPESAATLDSKGFIYFQMGKYSEALVEYQKALKLDDSIGEIHLHVAQAFEKMKQIPESIASYTTYIKLSPKAPDKVSVENKIDELKKWQDTSKNKSTTAKSS
jgi:tetratricopeptide (TPR) repeat protein